MAQQSGVMVIQLYTGGPINYFMSIRYETMAMHDKAAREEYMKDTFKYENMWMQKEIHDEDMMVLGGNGSKL